MYTSYRQQYTFGRGPVDISSTNVAASATVYLGGAEGVQSTVAACEPIDLKAENQMAFQKARLDFKMLTALTGSGATGVITLYTCDEDSDGDVDTSTAVELLSVPISTALGIAESSQPWLEITMPSNCSSFVYLAVTAGTTAFTTGTVLIHFNPNN